MALSHIKNTEPFVPQFLPVLMIIIIMFSLEKDISFCIILG